jgi:alanyl-tRNA synthetase
LPDVLEIWNVVFYSVQPARRVALSDPAAQHVDTGMGSERLTSILQDVDSNYDTDIFILLFNAIQKVTGRERTLES